MITWNSLVYHNPSSFLMEVVIIINDYVTIILLSVLIFVVLNITYTGLISFFNFEFFENHALERAWTVRPFIILLFIVIPSLISLYMLDSCLFCGLTLSIIGHQWYWSYFYKDFGNAFFDSYMLPRDSSDLRLIDVDNRVMVPSHTPVRFLVSSSDVIHSWTIPSFGVKIDAIPGRINQFCFSSTRTGVFFGQCSEICGTNHRFIPIVLESVSFSDFFDNVLLGGNLIKVGAFWASNGQTPSRRVAACLKLVMWDDFSQEF